MNEVLCGIDSIELLSDRILVRPEEGVEVVTLGGIILADSSKLMKGEQAPVWGRALKCGPGKQLECGIVLEPRVHPGDRVCYNRFSGSPVDIGGHKLLLVPERDMYAVQPA